MQNHLHFDSIDSTNAYLKRLAETSAKPLTAFFTITAGKQEHGRGRQQKSWESEEGKNLLMSVLLYPAYSPQKQFYVCRIVSLAVAEFLVTSIFSRAVSGAELPPKNVFIKYPNDIYIGNKKAAGILLEHSLREDKINYTIAGIGLNVNQAVFPETLPNPTSIFLETNKEISPFFCMEEIVKNIKEISTYPPAVLEQQYEQFLYKKNEFSLFLIPQKSTLPIEAKIVGVTANGLLHLTDRDNNSFFCGLNEIGYL